MQNTKTLSLKKPFKPVSSSPNSPRPEKSLVGRLVTIQTKSPTRIVGEIKSFDHGWVVITGTEYRWKSDGLLSAPVTTGTFSLDRSSVTYLCEVTE